MNWFQKVLLKGVDLRDAFPSYSEKKGNGGIRQPFTTNVFDRYNNSYDALSKKDYIGEFRNWPYACINARGESLGNIKLRLIDKGSGDEIDSHPILDLLNNPNPAETKYDLFYGTQAYKDLDGNAFWFLARENDGKGKIRQIYNLKSDKMKLVLDDTNPLTVIGYVYTQPDGEKIPFKPEEILHQRMFNPLAAHPYPHRGMGIIQAAAYAIDTDNETRKWNLAFFRNAARPDGILYSQGEGVIRPEEFKRQSEEWEERHKGSDNAGKTALLSGGMKWEAVTSTHTEMDFGNQRTFGRDEILAMFKVPKTVIGIADDVNRANADAAIYVYNLLTVKPLMQRAIDYINTFLLPLLDDSGQYKLDFHSPISEDREQLLDEYEIGANVWLTINEIRERENLPAVEGGDALYIPNVDQDISNQDDESDDAPPVPKKGYRKIKAKPKAKKTIAKKVVEKNAKPKSEAEKAIDKFVAKFPKKIEFRTITAQQKSDYVEYYKAQSAIRTNKLKEELRKYFDTQQREVVANLKEELRGLEPIEYSLKGVSDLLFDLPDAIKSGISLITPFIRDYIEQSGGAAAKIAGIPTFDSSTTFIKNWTTNRAQFFSESINSTTADKLSAQIQEGIAAKESLSDISARVAGVYDQARDYRTDMTARTEVAAASNFGSIEAYKQAGVTRHQWIVVSPDDEDCLENDGQIVDIGDAFESGDTDPPVHPNCQCTTVPVFDDDEEDTDNN